MFMKGVAVMKIERSKMFCLLVVVLITANFSMEVSHSLEVRGYDWSARNAPTYIELSTGKILTLEEGESISIESRISCVVIRRNEMGWHRIPVKPKRRLRVSLRRIDAVKPKPILFVLAMNRRRKVLFNCPPVSSPWHLPMGISQLTAILRNEDHEVVQRYGHIIGLEYILKQHGGDEINFALNVIRDVQSDIYALYKARMTLERISRSISSADKFVVARNNVAYVASDYDGSVESVVNAVYNRENNLWYRYFTEVEIPIALDFKPDIYGISIADERQLIPGLILASLVKDALPETLVVLGGNFWSRVVPVFMNVEFSRKLFNFCDVIVYREGFQPIQELVGSLKPSSASGTIWKDGNKLVVNPPSKIPTLFETLPTPEFDGGIRQWSSDKVYPLHTMSNCPGACRFCAIAAGSDSFLDKPRAMSPKRIAEHMAKFNVRRFDIVDETFLISRQLALGKELKRIGHIAEWQCYLNVTDKLLDPDVCDQLYDAGCRGVQLGFESLSPETLMQEHKNWNHPESYGRILENLKRVGIQTHIFIIVGLLGEPLNWSLRWLSFLEQYGDSILTIKATRYRLSKLSPEEQLGVHNPLIEVMPNSKPFHLNRDFRYRHTSRKRVEAVRDLLEQACREHWAYAITSTLPWWINRGRYSLDELREMAKILPKEEPVPHLKRAIGKVRGIVRDELGVNVQLNSYQDVLRFARTI